MHRLKERKLDILSFFILGAITSIFFLRLFYPHISLFIIPEFNGSDTTNFNIPIKQALSQALQAGEIPLWEKTIATGFPIFAESQIGYFFIPNFVLFSLFSFPIAFNLGYVLTFFIASTGMYVYLRSKGFSWFISLFTGFVFAFSGFYVGHMNHYNMIQSAALLPWLIFLFDRVRIQKTVVSLLIFSLVLSQQMFAGYAQITFITLCTILALHGIDLLLPLKNLSTRIKDIILLFTQIGIGTAISVILCAAMLLPTRELTQSVARPETYDVLSATYFSFPFSQFLGFLSPFVLGNPKYGTFPSPANYYGTFFWETVQYMGFIPFVFAIVYWLKNFRRKKVITLTIFIGLFAVLMLGKFSPAYFIYSFPPFNIFRVPSRFLLPVIFGFCILFAYALRTLYSSALSKLPTSKKNILFLALFVLAVCDIFYYWFNHYPIADAKKWLEYPEFAQYIHNDGVKGRVLTPRGGFDRSDVYGKNGWNNSEDYYIFSRNEMIPNANTTWQIPQLQGYTGLSTMKRHNLFEAALEFASSNSQKTRADILLDVAHVGYVIVSRESDQPYQDMKLVKRLKEDRYGHELLLYKNPSVLPRARVVTEYKVVETINEIVANFISMKEALVTTALLEEKVPVSSKKSEKEATVKWLKDENQHIQLEVAMPTDGLLLLADMYEKNWKAYDNGSPTKIYAANLLQRAVALKKGKHIVEYKYEPQSFVTGFRISLVGHVIVLLVLALYSAGNLRASSSKR